MDFYIGRFYASLVFFRETKTIDICTKITVYDIFGFLTLVCDSFKVILNTVMVYSLMQLNLFIHHKCEKINWVWEVKKMQLIF